jgi:5'-nucleotidase
MRPLILVTNDDGVFSPGLAAAAQAVRQLGDLLIVAPRRQQTTMGRSFPRTEGAGIIETLQLRLQGTEVRAYGVHGSPAQAVAHAVLELADRLPDLCVSGINYGENLGLSLTCSGTLGAVFEAFSHGIPGLAMSLATPLHLQHAEDYPELSWSAAQYFTGLLAAGILDHGLPAATSLLNVNVPASATATTGIRITRQSRLAHSVFSRPAARSFDTALQLGTELNPQLSRVETDSDIHALCFGKVVSVTPIGWDLSANATLECKPL